MLFLDLHNSSRFIELLRAFVLRYCTNISWWCCFQCSRAEVGSVTNAINQKIDIIISLFTIHDDYYQIYRWSQFCSVTYFSVENNVSPRSPNPTHWLPSINAANSPSSRINERANQPIRCSALIPLGWWRMTWWQEICMILTSMHEKFE